jgi:hypothetical protein
MIVWDVDFMDSGRTAGEIALMNNMIAYLAAPVSIGTPPAVPALSPSAMVVLSLLLGCAGILLLRRRFA